MTSPTLVRLAERALARVASRRLARFAAALSTSREPSLAELSSDDLDRLAAEAIYRGMEAFRRGYRPLARHYARLAREYDTELSRRKDPLP